MKYVVNRKPQIYSFAQLGDSTKWPLFNKDKVLWSVHTKFCQSRRVNWHISCSNLWTCTHLGTHNRGGIIIIMTHRKSRVNTSYSLCITENESALFLHKRRKRHFRAHNCSLSVKVKNDFTTTWGKSAPSIIITFITADFWRI